MELVIFLKAIIGLVASALFAFRITHDIVSGSPAGDVYGDDGKVKFNNRYYGEHDGYAGPFNLYHLIRKLAASGPLAERTKEGMSCRYCISFTASIIAALPLRWIVPGVFDWSLTLLVGLGIGGAIVLFFRLVNYNSIIKTNVEFCANDF